MNCIVVAVYPAYPPLISSRQCLRITASTCLLFVIIDYKNCRISPHSALAEKVFHAGFLKGSAHQRGANAVDKFIGICFIYHNKSCFVPRGLWREDIAWTLFLRLQVIVIATPPDWRLNAICRISQEMKDIIGAVSPRVAYCGRLNDVFPT